MELYLSFHFFHKIKHILIAVVCAIPFAVFTNETGADQYLKHKFSLFQYIPTGISKLHSNTLSFNTRSIIRFAAGLIQLLSFRIIKAGPPTFFHAEAILLSFIFSRSTLRLREPFHAFPYR